MLIYRDVIKRWEVTKLVLQHTQLLPNPVFSKGTVCLVAGNTASILLLAQSK